jgi:arsenite-transporting ATPase
MTGDGLPAFLSGRLDLLLFGGKGGVGKTTCATAAAVHVARQGTRPVRLLSTDPAHSVRDSLQADETGSLPAALSVEEFDAEAALERFREAHRETLRAIVSHGTLFDEEDVQRLLELAMPGMDEVMAFLRLADHLEESPGESSSAGELLIVDTAPTGHTLRLLETPGQFARWVGFLDTLLEKHRAMREVFAGRREPDELDRFVDRLHARTDRVRSLLRDPARCRFVVVTQAEPLILTETRQLLRTLRERSLPVADGVVNRWGRRTASASTLRDALASPAVDWWTLPDADREVQGLDRLSGLWTSARPLSLGEEERGDEPPRRVEEPPQVDAPIERPSPRLLLVAGKGGVGKTTLACATALHRARERAASGETVLLLSTDPAHSLATALQADLGNEPVEVARGLEAVEIDAAARFEQLRDDYAAEVRQFFREAGGANVDLPFDRPVAEGLMDLAPPGVDEVMGWTVAMEFLEDNRYDACVLDTAPTGHFVRLLEMPGVFRTWIQTFFRILRKYRRVLRLPDLTDRLVRLSKQVKAFQSLTASGDGAILGVTIPTAMAAAEMTDLRAAAHEHDVRLSALIVNRTAPPSAPAQRRDDEAAVLQTYRTTFPNTPLATVTDARPPLGVDALQALGDRVFGDGG